MRRAQRCVGRQRGRRISRGSRPHRRRQFGRRASRAEADTAQRASVRHERVAIVHVTPPTRAQGWLAHPAALVAAFVVVVAPTIFRHEMWHDELNSWDVARDAHSLPGLFANMHYEAHPALWYLCLYVLTRFTSDPRAMQALHLAIASTTVAVVAWASPFKPLERWLLAFGYFFVFEFAVISRGYALGILLTL